MGWKSCISCCAGNSDMKRDGEEVPVEIAQEVDEEFVFLEQYPTDKKVENPVCFAHELDSDSGTIRFQILNGKKIVQCGIVIITKTYRNINMHGRDSLFDIKSLKIKPELNYI
jgi:hypothetical protein